MNNKIVVDSSVWIDHFRRSNEELLALLKAHRVVTHELLIGELRCGALPHPRYSCLELLGQLFQIESIDMDEVFWEVERRKLFARGCGLVDLAVLIATKRTPGAKLWSRDKRMRLLAIQLGIPLQDVDAPVAGQPAGLTAASPTA